MEYDADEHLATLFPGPGPAPAWDAVAALALIHETDGAVAASGVNGLDPVIQAAAGRCVEAHRRHDRAGVEAACRAVRARVEQLAR